MTLKHLLTCGLFSLLACLSGCASVTKQAANSFPAPRPDQGLVYFYREKKLSGIMVSYNIKEDQKIVGAVANGTYFYLFADPGKHTYTATTEAEASRTLEIEPGKTYYIACGVELGIFVPRTSLSITHEAEAKSVLSTLTYATK